MGVVLRLGAGVVLVVLGSIIFWDKWRILEWHWLFVRVVVAGLLVLFKHFEI
jgi:hypothetical protein